MGFRFLSLSGLVVLLGYAGSLAMAGDTPREALRSLALAPDIKTVEKHLPNSVCDEIHRLDPDGRQRAEQAVLFGKRMTQQGTAVQVPEDDHALLVLEHEGWDTLEVKVDHEISDGGEALLALSLVAAGQLHGHMLVWLRLEDGEWRVTELQRPGFRSEDIVLDNPRLIASFRDPDLEAKEESAVTTLRTLRWGLTTYKERYPEVGLSDMTALGPAPIDTDGGEEPDAEHAGLVDGETAANSFVRDGYTFNYVPGGAGYSITARPREYHKTGTRSFYADDSGTIRSTSENRGATAADEEP